LWKPTNKVNFPWTPGFRGGVNKILALLGCYPTPVTSYKTTLRNIAEERRSQSNFMLATTVPGSHSVYVTSRFICEIMEFLCHSENAVHHFLLFTVILVTWKYYRYYCLSHWWISRS